eukprot:CAMPEP_0178424008 /NCGR_PEP_ID=MMETSP0689_2-20121128/27988_1 /TAXON_ID=160604 /ORGANISM="Amphidinium massartii, Strain CS-259" /LENGTH=1391 /DNA_ID=CAMNT_0020045631 /DNA_START=72 /DNA_END=4244 /DNA_ORIENTATION=+
MSFTVTDPVSGKRSAPRPITNDDLFMRPEDRICTMKVPHLHDKYPVKSYESRFVRDGHGHGFLDEKSWITSSLKFMESDDPNGEEFTCCLRAGPRKVLHWDAPQVKAAIVNCGGLCPGLNNVIREVVMTLWGYGVRTIYGIIGGYKGVMEPENWLKLTPAVVEKIHMNGGSFLVSDRGNPPHIEMAKMYQKHGINHVYIIGGDGTHKGAMQTYAEMEKMEYECSICGVPKTIDNDIPVLDHTFGFHTAVSEAVKAIDVAQTEAAGNANCMGLVKLMGRHAGFIALKASLASRNVDLCLIPEMEVDMEKVLDFLVKRRETKSDLVVIIAEGLGDTLIQADGADAGGNKKLADIGPWFKSQVEAHFKKKGLPLSVKYIDPSYMVRAAPADAFDSIYCSVLAQNAVHGSMAGYTGFSSIMVDHHYVMVPIYLITDRSGSVHVDITSPEFARMLWTTGQPAMHPDGATGLDSPDNKKRKSQKEKPDYISDPMPLTAVFKSKDSVRRSAARRLAEDGQYDNPIMVSDHPLNVCIPDGALCTQCIWMDGKGEGGKYEYLQFLPGGPRRKIYWEPASCKAVIINAGSLCPGLNTAIREITNMLYRYGCSSVFGALGGFNGVVAPETWRKLTPELVEDIHLYGGSWLLAERGNPPHADMAKILKSQNVTHIFVIGGHGTHQCATTLVEECDKINYKCSLGGVLNVIDNDIPLLDYSFGFHTAVEKAAEALDSAYIESRSSRNCLGLVQLMGRDSGFVALRAVVAAGHVDLCLIPEMDIDMPVVLDYLVEVVTRGSLDSTQSSRQLVKMRALGQDAAGVGAVCVITEGIGHSIYRRAQQTGLPIKNKDLLLSAPGEWFMKEVEAHFQKLGLAFQCKFVNPSFLIRASKPAPYDMVVCSTLAYQVVHAAMAGFTDFAVGKVDNQLVMIPIREVAERKRTTVNVEGRWFHRLVAMTKQPPMTLQGIKENPQAGPAMEAGRIMHLTAREILDSRGNPTVEVDVWTPLGQFRASVPSGASTGVYEALELRDGDKNRALGKGVLKAVANVKDLIAPKLIGLDATQQSMIDKLMVETIDGSKNEWGWSKAKLGANAILAVSMAVCRAGAAAAGLRLFQHIAALAGQPEDDFLLPVPSFNVINGGSHAGNRLACQEFMILPVGATTFREAMNIGAEVYQTLKSVLKKKYGQDACNVGDEGGFAPPVQDNTEALEVLMEAVKQSGHAEKVRLGTDVAASEFFVKESNIYDLDFKNPAGSAADMKMNAKSLAQYYKGWLDKYPLISIEDPFDQDDFEAYAEFNKMVGTGTQIVGDDLLVTNPKRVSMALDKKLCNALLLKVNQIGSITEAIEAAQLAMKSGWGVMVSHRSGETEDSFIADLVVGLRAGQIKTGAPCRSERLVKYNQLLR